MPPSRTKLYERYELGEVLGRGGMGVVYRAHDTLMDREVALKTLLDIDNPLTLELFYKECGILASMVHPNIINVYDVGEFEDNGVKKPFFVMPLLPGATLDKLIKDARVSVDTVIEIMSQACRGLQAAHEMGLVHRDVKPSNIFVMEDHSVKIIDFGVARAASMGSMTGLKGTLAYMAPEQLQYKPPSPLSDQYALAMVCYESLARRRPFMVTSESEMVDAILKQTPPPISDFNPNIKLSICQVVHKALAKQPLNRFSNVREFGDALNKALRSETIAYFDPAKIKPRLERATASFNQGDYEFASEVLTELESEGFLDPDISLLRRRLDQTMRQARVRQLLESANRYHQAQEYPLALRKIQEAIEIDPEHPDTLALKNRVEKERRERKMDEWMQLARQHVQNQSFQQAREALDNALKLRPNDTEALRLMAEIARREQDITTNRDKKQQIYEAALQLWDRGDVTTALSRMDMLVALERENPDTDSGRGSAYQSFYNQVRSEHDNLKHSYEEARNRLAAEDFDGALALCKQFLAKYPNHALFHSLEFDVEERRRQKLSAFIAETDRRADHEPDLNVRVALLEEAARLYPGEKHFQSSLRLVKDKRDLVNSIVSKAQLYEERQQFHEALDQWQILKSIHAGYPGLSFEIERVSKRRDSQSREGEKARLVEQIDRAIEIGEYDRATQILQGALTDFPNDPEFPELEKLVRKSRERTTQALDLVVKAREAGETGKNEETLPLLRQAHELDPRNAVVRAVLVNTLLEQANGLMSRDWQAAEPLLQEVLQIEPGHAAAQSLLNQSADRQREEFVTSCVTRARRLQIEGDLDGALTLVRTGLENYPREKSLQQLQATLERGKAGDLTNATRPQAAATRPGPPPSAAPVDSEAMTMPLAAVPPQVSHDAETVAVPLPPTPAEIDVTATVMQLPHTPTPTPTSASSVTHTPSRAKWDERMQKYREGLEPQEQDAAQPPAPPAVPPPPTAPPPATATPKIPPPKVPQAPPPSKAPAQTAQPAKKSSKTGLFAVVGVLLVALAGGAFMLLRGKKEPAPTAGQQPKVTLHASQPQATILIDEKPCGTGSCAVDLSPGPHRVEARLEGFAPASSTIEIKAGENPAPIELTLTARPPAVVISTNLEKATVSVDDGAEQAIQNGEVQLTDMAAGKRTIKFKGEGSQASIAVNMSPTAAPQVTIPIQQQNLGATIVSGMGGAAKVFTTLQGGQATVDGKPAGKIEASGLELTNLTPGSHEVVVTAAQGSSHRVVFDSGPVPAMAVFLGTEKNMGLLRVTTGEDDVTVYVNGDKTKRGTSKGRLVLYLPPKTYKIRVEKDGYQKVAEQTIEVKKGEEARAEFQLVRMPTVGTLLVQKAPAGAEVSIDGTAAGTVRPDGTLSLGGLKPGAHALSVKKDAFKPLTKEITVVAGQQVDVDAVLQGLSGTVKISVTPSDVQASFAWRREGEEAAQPFSGTSVALPEGTYTILGHAADYEDAKTTTKVVAGREAAVVLAFKKAAKSGSKSGGEAGKALSLADVEKVGGWTKDSNVLLRTGGNMVLLPAKSATGTYSFAAMMQKGKRLDWVIAYTDPKNYVAYELNDDHLERMEYVDGKKQNQAKPKLRVKLDQWIEVMVEVTPSSIVTSIKQESNNFPQIDKFVDPKTNLTQGKFGFKVPGKDKLAVGTFTFAPK